MNPTIWMEGRQNSEPLLFQFIRHRGCARRRRRESGDRTEGSLDDPLHLSVRVGRCCFRDLPGWIEGNEVSQLWQIGGAFVRGS
jgi:hypothetical protein